MKERVRRILLPTVFWLAVWQVCAFLIGKELILPAPLSVVRALAAMVGQGSFWRSLGGTLARSCGGFLLGAALGTALGLLTARRRTAEELLSPALRAVRTVPVVSFILLLYFSLPTSQVPTAVGALMALPVVWRAARQGIAAADPQLLELAGHYRLSPWRRLRYISIPAAMPALAAGWETGLGLSWKAAVAAEVLCQPKWAAGAGLQAAKATLDTAGLVAWTAAIVALSLAAEGLLRRCLRRWRGGGA